LFLYGITAKQSISSQIRENLCFSFFSLFHIFHINFPFYMPNIQNTPDRTCQSKSYFFKKLLLLSIFISKLMLNAKQLPVLSLYNQI